MSYQRSASNRPSAVSHIDARPVRSVPYNRVSAAARRWAGGQKGWECVESNIYIMLATRRARARRAKTKNAPRASSARRPARGNQRASCVDEPARGERRARGPFQNVGRQTRAQRALGRVRATGVASTHLADAVSGPAGARTLLCGRKRRRSGLRAGASGEVPRGARRSAKLTPRARAQQRQEAEHTTENTETDCGGGGRPFARDGARVYTEQRTR